MMNRRTPRLTLTIFALVALMLVATACAQAAGPSADAPGTGQVTLQQDEDHGDEMLSLPDIRAVDLAGERLQVVATTSIIGDVVTQVGGEAIDLFTLMDAGENPHSYEPAARDLTHVAQADILFINGWDLEENLVDKLMAIGEEATFVPVSAAIEPMTFDGADADHTGDHGHSGPDPHTWFSIHNVEQWVENIKVSLREADPAHAETYKANARAYLVQLQELDTWVQDQLAAIPPDKRYLITNHSALGYFARDYDFEVLGTVIPGVSTLAEPSASDLVDLIHLMDERGVCTIFTETTVSDSLAQTVAAELSGCDEVKVLPLYTGAIGPPGSGADSYVGMFRANVDTIVEGLQ